MKPELKNTASPIEGLEKILDSVIAQEGLFITGRAGTGKSTLLRWIAAQQQGKCVVVAPTGISAINIGGVTIHSFFGLPAKPLGPQDPDIKRFGKNSPKGKLLQKTEWIIIDEISMVRADLLDAIDFSLRLNTEQLHLPFGGKKMIFIGDLFQLEPVVQNSELEQVMFSQYYDTPYFFSAKVFEQFDFRLLELTKVHRQSDPYFINLLDSIRLNEAGQAELEALNERVNSPSFDSAEEYTIVLTTTNASANTLNELRLKQLTGDEQLYFSKMTGQFNANQIPAENVLRLKVGAQVVFLKNDPLKRWMNGTLGYVTILSHEDVVVKLEDGTEHTVQQSIWENNVFYWDEKTNRIATNTIGTFAQLPIKLAWAITIHKSQGLTFDKVKIDLGAGAFAHGQAYVALSRCRTLEGITLKRPIQYRDVIVDERIINYMDSVRRKRIRL